MRTHTSKSAQAFALDNMVIHSDATPARDTGYSSATTTDRIVVTWMHVPLGVFVACMPEKVYVDGLRRAATQG